MKKSLFALAITSALAACGGGGGGSPAPSTISGKVIDGYIEGATVCLDLNGNLACDPGEPSDTSKKDGSYSLSYNGSVDGLVVIADVGDNAKDADDGGKTIKEANKAPFNLAAPIAPSSSSVPPLALFRQPVEGPQTP